MPSNRVKGICFRDFLVVLEEEVGADGRARVVAQLRPEVGEALTYGGVVRGGWYDIEWYAHLHRVAARVADRPDLARRVGQRSTYMDLTAGVYRVFARVASPEFVIRRAPALFNSYYERGAMQVTVSRAGMAQARWSGCRGFDRNLWWDLFGGCEGALTACGAENIRVRVVSGGGDGDEAAVVEARWT